MVTRTTDPDVIEQRLLELAFTSDVKITPSVLAYYAPCSLADASKVLDALVARDQLTMDVEDSGAIVYTMRDRQSLPAHVAAKPSPPAPLPVARMVVPHEVSPAAAALLSVAIPGAGHLYARRFAAAVMWFFVVSLGYALIFPGLLLHMFSVISAAASARQLNAGARLQLQG